MFEVIQLRWSDEENWRDVQTVEVGAVAETIGILERGEANTRARYPHHTHHAVFRVKPKETT